MSSKKIAKEQSHSESVMTPTPFVITVSARALFDLEESHRIFEEEGIDAFSEYQRKNENVLLEPGPAFPLVKKLLAINEKLPENMPKFEVILISRNSMDTGMRVFNSIEHWDLPISRAVFTSGRSSSRYVEAAGVQLFLSTNPVEVRKALEQGIAAATMIPSKAKAGSDEEIRIAFDGDAVLFSDEAEKQHLIGGLDGFHEYETKKAGNPLPFGPFYKVIEAIHRVQESFTTEDCPIRTALVTARSAPAHRRPINTLRQWGIRIDEGIFLGGRNKAPFLRAFGADLFFDDSKTNIDMTKDIVASAHVPYGARNEEGADDSKFSGGHVASSSSTKKQRKMKSG